MPAARFNIQSTRTRTAQLDEPWYCTVLYSYSYERGIAKSHAAAPAALNVVASVAATSNNAADVLCEQ